MKIFKRSLAPGAETVISHPGRFVRGIGGAKRYQIAVDQGQKTDFETGIAHEWPRQFTQLTVSNPADTEQTIEVAIADGFVSDNRMVGRVDITGGIDSNILAPASIATGSASVTATGGELVPANDDRASLLIVPLGGKIWVGGTGVTVDTGIPVSGAFTLASRAALYAVTESGQASVDVRWMEEVK